MEPVWYKYWIIPGRAQMRWYTLPTMIFQVRNAPSIIWCVRTLRYKYAVYFTPDGDDADWELYDLQLDPDEEYNVAGQSRYGDIQLELETKLQNVMPPPSIG